MALQPYIGNENPEGQETELIPFIKGAYWTAQAYTAFTLVNPMMTARDNSFSGIIPDITQFTGATRGPKTTGETLFDLGSAAAGLRPAAILNRALRSRIVLDEGALYGLESYFSPFIESRMAKGHFKYSGIHDVGGSKAFADIYDLGIANRIGTTGKIETSAAAWLASVTMHHPILRTFSIYPALMNIAMPTDRPLDVSLFNFEAGLSDTKIGFTKHTILYGQRFKKFKNDRLLAHGIDLYSHEGLESFNTRLQEAATDLRYERMLEVQDQLKNIGLADVQHQKLLGLSHKEFQKLYGGSLTQEEFNALKLSIGEGPTLGDIFKRAGIDEHIAQELPMFMRLKDGKVTMGKYAHYTGAPLDSMDIVSEKAFSVARAHGKMGKHQYASKYVRTVEASAGLTDIDSERIDERLLFLEDNTFDIGDPFAHSTAKDSLQTVYSRLTRLLDNPFDILSYFGMEETHAEKMARVQDIIEEAVGKTTGTAGTIYSEGRAKRVIKNIFLNRFGTGGDYTGGFLQNIRRSLLPGFVNLEQEKSAFIVLGRKSEMSHLSSEEFYDAMKEVRDEYVTKFKDADEGVLKLVSKEGLEAFKKEGMTPFVQMSSDVAYISATYTTKMRRFNVGMLGFGLAMGGAMDLIPIVREPFRVLNKLRATIGESTGLMGYADQMERVAPGSTSPLNIMGFGLGGLFAGYFGAKMWQWNALRGVSGGYEKAAMREAFEMKRAIANPYVRYMSEKMGFGGAKTMAGKFGMYGMAAGLLLNLPFLPAQLSRLAFGSKTTGQLEAEYEGRAQVPVMKGRWWEAGVSHFGGEKLAYYRPSMSRVTPKEARDMDLYGAPNSNFMNIRSTLEQMFTYNIEDRNYFRRPYPVTAAPFGDIFGLASPLVNATVGEFIKPTRYMHRGDVQLYSDEEGDPYMMAIPGSGKYAKEAESTTPGEYARINLPGEDSPLLVDKLTSRESFYRIFQEAPGLVGFVGQSYIEGTTGQAIIYDDQPFAERADRMTSGGRLFWDMELGGLGTLSEPMRRMYPSRRFVEDWQNPIANDQPSWMPGEKEMINFKIGDPYRISAGEMRVPGPGYTLLRPDLEGVDPEDYDTATRLSVLANIAPYSKAYKRELKRFKNEQEQGLLTPEQLELGATAQLMRRNMIQAHKYNPEADNLSILSGYYKTTAELFRSNPFERLVPFAPAHKFLAQRTAIEEYREYLEYGGDMARWTNPVEDFVARFARAWIPFFSTDIDPDVSERVQEARRINGIFNAMEYLKGQSGGKATNFRSQNSIPGVNPFSANLEDIVKAMPGGEKPYFYAFAEEESLARQKIILSMVPEEHHRIYKAIWARKLVHQIRDENNSYFARETANKAASIISTLAENEASYLTEGIFSKRKVSEAEFRNNIATAIIEKYDGNVPNREWLGWNKDVKLSDVKLQYVMDEGMDIHDFNLWEPQVRELAYKDKIPDITDEYVHSDFYNVAQAVQAMTVTRDYGYSGGYNDSTNVYVTPTDRELQQVYKQDEY